VRPVDAHHHYWRLAEQAQSWRTAAHAAIERDYEPADLAGELQAAGVGATVLVESVDTAAENDRLREYAATTPTVAGVVAWLPVRDPAAARAELDRIADLPRLAGVRCLVGREPLDWLAEPAVRALLAEVAARGLAWDVVAVTPEQVAAVCALAAAVPELRIVVDHLARPPLDGGEWAPWERGVRALAAEPGIALKVSIGVDLLTAWDAWDAAALRRPVATAVEHLTPRRLMLASNWPVVELRRPYGGAWADQRAALEAAGVAGDDLAAVLGGTAEHWYRLGGASVS